MHTILAKRWLYQNSKRMVLFSQWLVLEMLFLSIKTWLCSIRGIYLHLYIYKRKFARLSLTLSITPITHLQLPTSTLQPSNVVKLLSVNFKFITSSSRGVQFALCSVCALQQVEEEDAKQHSIETTTASIAQLIEQLTLKHEVEGLNPSRSNTFFFKQTHVFLAVWNRCYLRD